MPRRKWSGPLKKLLSSLILVFVSLVAAVSITCVWRIWTGALQTRATDQCVREAIQAFKAILLPGASLAAIIFTSFHFLGYGKRFSVPSWIRGGLFLSLFFGSMILADLLLGLDYRLGPLSAILRRFVSDTASDAGGKAEMAVQ